MALVIGTNCGFVTTAPTTDPGGNLTETIDTRSNAGKFTSPVGAGKITEIGYYVNIATEAATNEVGIYLHDSGNDKPNELLSKASFAKGTTAGWKVASGLNIVIEPETIYWLAAQCDDTSTTTRMDLRSGVGGVMDRKLTQTTLTSAWGTSLDQNAWLVAIYAVWEAPPAGTNMQVNIDDTMKDVATAYVNVDDAWKEVASAVVNVDDAWKTIF